MKLEKLIGKGKYNEVYKSGDAAIKLFNEGYAKADVLNEAYIIALIEEVGLNIPKLREVPIVDGKLAIVMELTEGKTLEQLMKENPADSEKYVDQMLDIQLDMHEKRCPHLQKYKDKLVDRINRAGLDENKKYEMLMILDGLPKHKKICHGDFIPQNIMISNDKAYILDWNHATQGNASADVARSYLWLSLHMPDVADMYLDKFCAKTDTQKRYVQQWMPIVAAARMYKHIPGEEELLQKWIDVVSYE